MGAQVYACGCYVTRSMYGERGIVALAHCWQHIHLYDQDKTPRQMAAEMAQQDHTWRPLPIVATVGANAHE